MTNTTKPRLRILLAENDIDLLDIMARNLQRHYEILKASGLAAAIDILDREDTIDLVVTDLRLVSDGDSRDFSGFEVYDAADQRGIPVILHTSTSPRSIGSLRPDVRMVSKLAGPGALKAKIAEMLENTG